MLFRQLSLRVRSTRCSDEHMLVRPRLGDRVTALDPGDGFLAGAWRFHDVSISRVPPACVAGRNLG
jgi:hypothetical protein